MPARSAARLVLIVLLAAAAWLAAPRTAEAATGSDGVHASAATLAKAQRELVATRKRRAAACRRGATRRCRTLRRRARRGAARVRTLRLKLRLATTAPRSAAPTPARKLYVAAGGRDSGTGAAGDPLATLTEALRRASGGEVIEVGPGSYPRATDTRERTRTVAVVGPGVGAATVRGMTIEGGQELDVRGLSFTDIVSVRWHTTRKLAQPARNLVFRSSDFTAPAGQGCLTARNAVRNFTVARSHIHDCTTGFGAGAGATMPRSSGLTFIDNTFERFTTDALQFGSWDDVRIAGNVIRDITDPCPTATNCIHNDGIQLTGYDRAVVISRNRISNARTQLIFIQDAVGPIDDVTVENNLVHGAGAVAIQSQGATNARFLHNTVWGGKDGGLWLTQGFKRDGTSVVPTDSVVANNVLSTYRRLGGARTRTSAGNAIACLSGQRPAANPSEGWTCFTDMLFAADYRLLPDSPVRAAGSTKATVPVDIDGTPRTAPVPGAFR
jgi:hypothetical protein